MFWWKRNIGRIITGLVDLKRLSNCAALSWLIWSTDIQSGEAPQLCFVFFQCNGIWGIWRELQLVEYTWSVINSLAPISQLSSLTPPSPSLRRTDPRGLQETKGLYPALVHSTKNYSKVLSVFLFHALDYQKIEHFVQGCMHILLIKKQSLYLFKMNKKERWSFAWLWFTFMLKPMAMCNKKKWWHSAVQWKGVLVIWLARLVPLLKVFWWQESRGKSCNGY